MNEDIKKYLSTFKVKFDIDPKAIDLREMCKNYEMVDERNGFIPLDDISKAIDLINNRYKPITKKYDPYKNSSINNDDNVIASHTEFVEWKDLYLWPLFQRDVSPNHIRKISLDFNPTAVITPCAIKLKVKDKAYYFVWDGHHTLQVCRLHGYTRFKIDVIDIDMIPSETIEAEGFQSTNRVGYGVWIAGQNMVRINSRNKRPLHAYDEFMIKYESKDKDTMSIMNILNKHGVVPHRKSKAPKHLTQIKSAIECFYLLDSQGVKGRFLDRALNFHTKYWPSAPIELELFRPMAYLYQLADVEGTALDAEWDKEMFELIAKHYGDPETCQYKLKESYWAAVKAVDPKKTGAGDLRQHDRERVLDGLLCLYHQKGGTNSKTPQAEYRWNL